jgi:hypothetical protein
VLRATAEQQPKQVAEQQAEQLEKQLKIPIGTRSWQSANHVYSSAASQSPASRRRQAFAVDLPDYDRSRQIASLQFLQQGSLP